MQDFTHDTGHLSTLFRFKKTKNIIHIKFSPRSLGRFFLRDKKQSFWNMKPPMDLLLYTSKILIKICYQFNWRVIE